MNRAFLGQVVAVIRSGVVIVVAAVGVPIGVLNKYQTSTENGSSSSNCELRLFRGVGGHTLVQGDEAEVGRDWLNTTRSQRIGG